MINGVLVLRQRKIESLAEINGLDAIKSLKILDLGYNKLSSLPESIEGLKLLETLNLNHNELRSLPESMIRMESLKELHISFNYLDLKGKSIREQLKNKGVKIVRDI